MEYKIFAVINNVYDIYMNVEDVDQWIRIDEELSKLFQLHSSIISTEIANSLLYKNNNMEELIQNQLLKPYYSKNLSLLKFFPSILP